MLFFVILTAVNELNLLKIQDASLCPAWQTSLLVVFQQPVSHADKNSM